MSTRKNETGETTARTSGERREERAKASVHFPGIFGDYRVLRPAAGATAAPAGATAAAASPTAAPEERAGDRKETKRRGYHPSGSMC
jgi:hypothetical protein